MERGVFDINAVKEANANLIATIDESLSIADEGKRKRADAEVELKKMEADLKATLAAAKARGTGTGHKGCCVGMAAGRTLRLPTPSLPEISCVSHCLMNTLARITGLNILQSNDDPNFHVFVLNEGDRQDFAPRLRELVPGIATSSLNAIINLPRDQLCIVVAFSQGGASRYSKAIAVIRGEHPDLLRTSCFHEELAQGLGLANDSPQARPSIFNDDS